MTDLAAHSGGRARLALRDPLRSQRRVGPRRLVRWKVCQVKEMKVLFEPMFRFVVEGNRVAARPGGKQPETNHQTAGYELDSA